jgi:hypothetical protein
VPQPTVQTVSVVVSASCAMAFMRVMTPGRGP